MLEKNYDHLKQIHFLWKWWCNTASSQVRFHRRAELASLLRLIRISEKYRDGTEWWSNIRANICRWQIVFAHHNQSSPEPEPVETQSSPSRWPQCPAGQEGFTLVTRVLGDYWVSFCLTSGFSLQCREFSPKGKGQFHSLFFRSRASLIEHSLQTFQFETQLELSF